MEDVFDFIVQKVAVEIGFSEDDHFCNRRASLRFHLVDIQAS